MREPQGTEPSHEFGPAPIVAPSHGIGFRSVPRHVGPDAQTPLVGHNAALPEPETAIADTFIGPEPTPTSEDQDEVEPADAPRHAADLTDAVEEIAAEVAPGDLRPGRHRREHSAVSGTVRSTRGRGLRDMQVVVLDEQWQVIATAVTGTDGMFVVEDLPPGAYRLMATDELDGDFGAGWHDSSTHSRAGILQVKEGRTRRNVDMTLPSAAAVDLDVDVRRKKAIVAIRVTERATGVRAKGSVRVSTKRFSTELPLTRGRTAITLFGSADGTPRLSKKVKVDYLGTKHVLPGSASVRLR